MAMLGSAVVFAVTSLLLVFFLTFAIYGAMVPATVGEEKRFEQRLEYAMFAVACLICWVYMVIFA